MFGHSVRVCGPSCLLSPLRSPLNPPPPPPPHACLSLPLSLSLSLSDTVEPLYGPVSARAVQLVGPLDPKVSLGLGLVEPLHGPIRAQSELGASLLSLGLLSLHSTVICRHPFPDLALTPHPSPPRPAPRVLPPPPLRRPERWQSRTRSLCSPHSKLFRVWWLSPSPCCGQSCLLM